MSPRTKNSVEGSVRVDNITEQLAKLLKPLDTELFVETSELLEEQRGELARLKAQVRWLEGKPYRPSADKAPKGQLALALLAMMKSEQKTLDAAPEAEADSADRTKETQGKAKTTRTRLSSKDY